MNSQCNVFGLEFVFIHKSSGISKSSLTFFVLIYRRDFIKRNYDANQMIRYGKYLSNRQFISYLLKSAKTDDDQNEDRIYVCQQLRISLSISLVLCLIQKKRNVMSAIHYIALPLFHSIIQRTSRLEATKTKTSTRTLDLDDNL